MRSSMAGGSWGRSPVAAAHRLRRLYRLRIGDPQTGRLALAPEALSKM